MTVLITGGAGFIGSTLSRALLARGDSVIGVDNLDSYYDVSLKQARIDTLTGNKNYAFHKLDIADREAMQALFKSRPDIDRVVNLAAQAGVRYSLVNPYAYTHSNVEGFLVVLECCRAQPKLKHLVYASSSSVYGGNKKMPFSTEDRVDNPISMYAATKKANELMAHTYSHLYRLPTTGLRYFTVYGPWGRPDMAACIFAKAILEDRPIPVFNNGDMRRDFTYIDDIVAGTIAVLDRPPQQGLEGEAPYNVYNIGNNNSEPLMRFIQLIEQALGKTAAIDFLPMQPGDVRETYADIDAIQKDCGYQPKTTIDEGIPKFIDWYRGFYKV
ncbi:MAG: GDP-mannose 4,6-dehydratase [Alphaproteobacteria bacterium]|nr:GDP-mannose 4,6-dehydratase [Alphaproteobacteria bacterium]